MEIHNQRADKAKMKGCFIATGHTSSPEWLSNLRQLLTGAALAALLSGQFCPAAICQADDPKDPDQAAPETKPEQKSEAKPKPKAMSAEAVKHYNRGLEAHQSGFYPKAIEEYRAAIASDDRLEQAYSNLGLIYIAQRSYNLAQDAFDKALFLRPNRPTSLNGLASVLYARGQVGPALEKWQKAVEIDPKFASAYFNMGTALESQKKPDEALKVYVKAVNIAPDMADAFYHMGNLLNKERHPAQALILFRKAIDLAPESEFARDARKQIGGIENQFAKESGKKEKVVSKAVEPTGPPSLSVKTDSPSRAATREDIAETAASDAKMKELQREAKAHGLILKKAPKEGGAFFGFGKPKKVDPNLKMFVQPPPGPENYPGNQNNDE